MLVVSTEQLAVRSLGLVGRGLDNSSQGGDHRIRLSERKLLQLVVERHTARRLIALLVVVQTLEQTVLLHVALAFAPTRPAILEPDLHTSLGQVALAGQLLAQVHVGIMSLLHGKHNGESQHGG